MQDSPVLDELDRSIVAALQLDGRASWSKIARLLGASESTVVRRSQQLFDRGLTRVIAMIDTLRCGLGVPVLVRYRSRPGAALRVAEELVARPETRFVALVGGSTDCVAELILPDHRQLADMVVAEQPSADLIVDAETLTVVRTFTSAYAWDPGLLSAEATEQLRPGCVPPFEERFWGEPPETLTDHEMAIIAALRHNGRLPFSELARQLDMRETTVARRVDSLVERGCLQFRTLTEPGLLGFGVEFWLWLSVHPAQLHAAGIELARHPGTKYASATLGRYNLCAHVSLPRFDDVYDYSTEVIGTLPGVTSSDITLHVRSLKRVWTPIHGQTVAAAE